MANIVENRPIMEMRNQAMVFSRIPHNLRYRPAHFLEPSFPTNEVPRNLPPQAFIGNNPNNPQNPHPLNPKFIGWQKGNQKWQNWVSHMCPRYSPIWKDVGIYEAIMSSTGMIYEQEDLVLALARKWYPETNTFVFKGMETTVTLEDVRVLGGYSVLGESVSDPHDTATQDAIREADSRLRDARRFINHTSAKKVTHSDWIKLFMEQNGNEFMGVEHEAFLVFWLSTFVFPRKAHVVGKHVHSLAIRLARGIRIALAPAVLASLYRDLTTIKREMFAPPGFQSANLNICSPMHLVQVWAWERFVLAKPNDPVMEQQVMARWVNVKPPKYNNIVDFLETRGFWMRPYTGIFFKFYPMTRNMYQEKERWMLDSSDGELEEDVQTFVKFLRPSELVGLDCIEKYLPQRVARQFGFDQDVPGQVSRFNQSESMAWANYDRPVSYDRLWILPRHVEGDVTARYWEWWTRSRLASGAG